MQQLTWDELDELQTAEEVADLLLANDWHGLRNHRDENPLARATGWRVYYDEAVLIEITDEGDELVVERHPLTEAEKAFIRRFNVGGFEDLG
jgi:hypothetical protein